MSRRAVLAFHATPTDDNRYLLEEIEGGRVVRDRPEPDFRASRPMFAARLVLCGHSHRPDIVRLPGGPVILNPGSVGCPAYKDTTYVSEVRIAPRALCDGRRPRRDGEFSLELIAVPYEHEAAARRAEANDRPEWASRPADRLHVAALAAVSRRVSLTRGHRSRRLPCPSARSRHSLPPHFSGQDLMPIANSVIDLIGNTPLIRLKRASEATGCDDSRQGGVPESRPVGEGPRRALDRARGGARRVAPKPGGTIVEGTAGNTGIGLSLVAKALGYRSVIVIPDTQSEEKKLALRLGGAELIEVPAVPYKNPNNYVKLSGRLAAQLAKTVKGGAIWANQFDNVANRQAHIEFDRPGNLGGDGRQDRRLRLRGRHRRHARRRQHVPEGARTRRSRSGSPTCPAPRSTITMRTAR